MQNSIIQEFIQALDQEIEVIKRGNGGSTVKIFNGRFIREFSGFYVYVFNLENFLAVMDEAPAEIEIHGQKIQAKVLLTQGLEVEIAIERSFGQYIQEARLFTNLWYLLDILKKKYEECLNGSIKIDFTLAEKLFSWIPLDVRPHRTGNVDYTPSNPPPNESQKKAIEASFFSEFSMIWGPPGTGKTTTIAKAIEAHLNAGRKILLVSHANNAVDEALEAIAKHLKDTDFYQMGQLVRLGKPQNDKHDKLERDYPLVLLDQIAKHLGESLEREKRDLINEKDSLEAMLCQLDDVCQKILTADALEADLDSLEASIEQLESRESSTKIELETLQDIQEQNRKKLHKAEAVGVLKRLLLGLDPKKIQHEIDHNNILLDSKKRTAEILKDKLAELDEAISAKTTDLDKTEAELEKSLEKLGLSESQVEEKRENFQRRMSVILSRITEINRLLEEIQKKILIDAKLLATTLTKTFTAKQFPDIPFDVLVIDEASMAPLPYIYWACSRCRKFITIVGDFKQLAPICIAKDKKDKPMAKKWLARSIYDCLGVTKVSKALGDARVTLLDTQCRMHPEISKIPNELFYGGLLKDGPKTLSISMADGIAKSPLALVDTSEMNPWCSRISTGGRFNLYNALVSTTLAKHIMQNVNEGRIGVITPYSHQARLINKIARDWGISDRIRVSTVHKFQGGEESVIIFDLVEAPGVKVAPMLDDVNGDKDAQLVLNVALTRAKSRIYLIAHTKHLLSCLHAKSSLAKIINHFCQSSVRIDPSSLVDKYFVSDFEKWAKEFLNIPFPASEPISGQLHTEKDFWQQFLSDIKGIKNKLIILSPFLSIRRSTMLIEFFRALGERGVNLRIYTRPRKQQFGELAYQAEIVMDQLRAIGVKVIERHNMHQKIAILDDTILWEGSLNILSHRDSEEQMRRFEGLSTVEEVIRNLELEGEMSVGEQTEERCPKCGDGFLVIRMKYGRKFYGCSNFPTCDYTRPIHGSTRKQRYMKSNRQKEDH